MNILWFLMRPIKLAAVHRPDIIYTCNTIIKGQNKKNTIPMLCVFQIVPTNGTGLLIVVTVIYRGGSSFYI